MRLAAQRIAAAFLFFAGAAAAQSSTDALHGLSDAVQALSTRANRAVVQVFSTGYALAEDDEESHSTTAGLVTRQRSTGSGVVLSPDGFIVTNNHVVQNARRVRVQLAASDVAQDPLHPTRQRGRIFEARVVGTDRDSDLAVLKIESSAPLPTLKLADSEKLRQGQVVLAFGNPLGLENSLSLGVVSSVGRQVRPDDPMTYIQTDAPINPGNSGGPLLDANGDIVGINTFIYTQSGGSEGIGFAIPSNIVQNIYDQIRKDGHVHRGEIGVSVQSITPELAAGLGLHQDSGAILADVEPEGPADTGGLKPGDIVVALNGRTIHNAREFQVELYRIPLHQAVTVQVLRDADKLKARVTVAERENDPFRFLDLVKPETNQIPKLGIIGIAITKDLAQALPETRKPYGVIVAARSGEAEYGGQGGLKLGDVIYSINNAPVATLDSLRQAIDRLGPLDPLVLQIERDGKLVYLTLTE
ncbi:MAG TPA: trypsin-like peptidase domain-containing protein [Bryobacteraceae bacterium]|nr:trypsin-like peptidase domain-containing protein [Bryobacteraceae bacterium]